MGKVALHKEDLILHILLRHKSHVGCNLTKANGSFASLKRAVLLFRAFSLNAMVSKGLIYKP